MFFHAATLRSTAWEAVLQKMEGLNVQKPLRIVLPHHWGIIVRRYSNVIR